MCITENDFLSEKKRLYITLKRVKFMKRKEKEGFNVDTDLIHRSLEHKLRSVRCVCVRLREVAGVTAQRVK